MEGIAAEEKTAREDLISAQTLVSRLTASTEEAEQLNEQALREYDELTARVEELRKQKLTGGELVKKLTEEVARLNRMDVESTAAHTALTEAIEEAARQVTCKWGPSPAARTARPHKASLRSWKTSKAAAKRP